MTMFRVILFHYVHIAVCFAGQEIRKMNFKHFTLVACAADKLNPGIDDGTES